MYLEPDDNMDLDFDQPPEPDSPDTSHSSEGPINEWWRLVIEIAFEREHERMHVHVHDCMCV